MSKKSKSVLVIGFNTRPLAYSLNRAGYKVFAVDFFGDLDLYPYVKDCIIVAKRLGTNYNLAKDHYSDFLVEYSIELLNKYSDIDYYLIGSGLDDNFEGRKKIMEETLKSNYDIQNLNNSLPVIIMARDLYTIYKRLKTQDYKFPPPKVFEELEDLTIDLLYPYILKKKTGSGGINVFKINNSQEFDDWVRIQERKGIINTSDWIVQEFIEGIPVSCTIISDGVSPEVISVNKQIIGLDILNSPQEFMYCGNVVPSDLDKESIDKISEISLWLSEDLGLKGINGFDFVLRDNIPYFMEINPRIPGSISCSEESLNVNLMDLHIQSFINNDWNEIKKTLHTAQSRNFATKLICFAPNKINIESLKKINELDNIFDKTEPVREINRKEPVCSILFKGNSYLDSYNGALKVVENIKKIINKDEN